MSVGTATGLAVTGMSSPVQKGACWRQWQHASERQVRNFVVARGGGRAGPLLRSGQQLGLGGLVVGVV